MLKQCRQDKLTKKTFIYIRIIQNLTENKIKNKLKENKNINVLLSIEF